MKTFVISVLFILGAAACSSETGRMSPKPEPQPQPPQQFDTSDLFTRSFTLVSDLSFFTADGEKVKVQEGTGWETDAVRYSFSYREGRRIRTNGLDSHSYCSVQVDVPPSKRPEDIQIPSQRMKRGIMSTSKKGDQISFSVALKGGPFQALTLFCNNVRTAAEVNSHIGELISVK